jgi:hypothetical protein
MDLVDLFTKYSPRFALLAIVLIIVGLVQVLASGNSVGWVPLLCGLVIGGALWGVVRKHANPTTNQTSQERTEVLRQRQNNLKKQISKGTITQHKAASKKSEIDMLWKHDMMARV